MTRTGWGKSNGKSTVGLVVEDGGHLVDGEAVEGKASRVGVDLEGLGARRERVELHAELHDLGEANLVFRVDVEVDPRAQVGQDGLAG